MRVLFTICLSLALLSCDKEAELLENDFWFPPQKTVNGVTYPDWEAEDDYDEERDCYCRDYDERGAY